ncbi:MAG: hypothetical protein EZS28_049152 [Streblomastix strix]|uniref:Uncharacterized protein n=1 Tax=Streblomastix strix TaxID=222440 RepID=A0A5J4TCD2_9EUKA|nr:MAG: hypothetical protein EZS28_049152 [Streblomastix strix]
MDEVQEDEDENEYISGIVIDEVSLELKSEFTNDEFVSGTAIYEFLLGLKSDGILLEGRLIERKDEDELD